MKIYRSWGIVLTTSAALLLTAAWLFLPGALPAQALATTRYVASGGCGSASPCYSTIQDAVDASQPGDEIRVAAGMYPIQAGNDQVVHVDKNLTIIGGYTTSNWDTPNPDDNATIVNALSQGRVILIDSAVDTTIEGLRMVYGNSTDLGSGGGIYANGASLTLRHAWVMTNTAPTSEMGGGIYVNDSSLTIESSIIQSNQAHSGGGLRILSSAATIRDSQILSNTANGGSSGWGGGGVLVGGTSQVSITDSEIRDNETGITTGGGGIMVVEVECPYCTGQLHLYLYNNLIEGNFGNVGGGVNIYDVFGGALMASATIISNTIQDNYSFYGGGGVSVSANVTVTHNIISDNHGGTIKGEPGSNYGDGGGIYASKTALIEHNLIQGNEAKGIGGNGRGGGAYFTGGTAITFRFNTVTGNYASGALGGRGGGLFINGDNILADANFIQGNSAGGGDHYAGGGGVHFDIGASQLSNNMITGNSVGGDVTQGSGITVAGGNPTLIHNTVANNTGGAGQGIYVTTGVYPNAGTAGQPVLYNTIIATQTIGIVVDNSEPLNMATLYGVLWAGNTTDHSGTIFAFDEATGDPAFLDPTAGDYHIQATSAAIDQGVDSDVTRDIDNESRFGTPDLGADEFVIPGSYHITYLPVVTR